MRFNLQDRRVPALVALLIAGIGLLPTLRFAWWRIGIVRGWEADAIAQSITEGYGFSFPGTSRWLWEMWKGNPAEHFPTAWVDPVYTYMLAAVMWLFGDYAYWAMYALNFACIGVILWCAFQIAARFGGQWAGTLAVAFISVNTALGRSFFDDISNSVVATCALTVLGLVAVRYFEKPERPRLITLGLATGFVVLTCPAAQTFMFFLAIAVMLHHRQRFPDALGAAAGRGIAILALACLVIAPWTFRNYLTFGEFVPIRNGAGQIIWDGTVALGATYIPGAAKSPLPPPWQSSGARDAVQKMMVKEPRIEIHHYQLESVIAAPPPGYESMNEAQRDQFYMTRTKEFIKEHPLETARMAVAKIEVFIMRFGILGMAIIVLAVGGALLSAFDPRSWPLTLLTVSYCGPFLLIVAYYGRYRAPIEPLLAVLAAVGVALLARRFGMSHSSASLQPSH